MRIIERYLVVGKTVKHGKEYIERLNLDFDTQTVNYYRVGGLEFRFTTIDQLKNGMLRGQKKFTYALINRDVSVGDYHDCIKPITKKDKFTVF